MATGDATSLLVDYDTAAGTSVTKSITYANPDTEGSKLYGFVKLMVGLTTNSLKSVYRVRKELLNDES